MRLCMRGDVTSDYWGGKKLVYRDIMSGKDMTS